MGRERVNPKNADLGRRSGGCASRHCEVHTCAIIFGLWPLLPLRYNKITFISYLLISLLSGYNFPIKFERTNATAISIQPQHLAIEVCTTSS